MTHRQWLAVTAAVLAAACNNGNGGGNAQSAGASPGGSGAAPSTASAPVATPMAATGAMHAVKMVQDAKGYYFDPSSITVKAGDAITFTVASGIPHNVTFWADSVPPSAVAQLAANMPSSVAMLTSPQLTAIGATYTMSTTGIPAGTYRFYCTPHLQYGMKGVITVQ